MLFIIIPLILSAYYISISARYIKPYKTQALDISRPYPNTDNITYNLTFSITEVDIPPSIYLLINFQEIEYFYDNNTGSLLNCRLIPYEETAGAKFDPLTDLNLDQSSFSTQNKISQCFTAEKSPFFFFKLNETLKTSHFYQLSFQMTASFNQFATALSLYFISNLNIDQTTYIYSSNLIYDVIVILSLPDTYKFISLTMQPIYYNQKIYEIINQALNKTLLTYGQAILTHFDVAVKSFNEMIKNSDILGVFIMDTTNFPEDITTYPGFIGNLLFQIYIDKEIDAFSSFELNIPIGWTFEDSNCISLDFYKDFQLYSAISHTKCSIQSENKLKFYNIDKISINTYVLMNITKVRNPIIPSSGVSKFRVFNAKNSEMLYQTDNISTFIVKTQKNLLVYFNTTDTFFTNKTRIFLAKSQRFIVNISLPFSCDLLTDTKLIITQNNSDSEKYGFLEDSCEIVNKDNALYGDVQCDIYKNQLIIKNINRFYSGKYFQIYFMNKNEDNFNYISFLIEIYSLDSTTPSFSTNRTQYLSEEALNVSQIYYQLNNSNETIFNYSSISLFDTPILVIEFIAPSSTINIISLIINSQISVKNISCSLNSIFYSCNIIHGNEFNVIFMNFTNTTQKPDFSQKNQKLQITGLFYKKITINTVFSTFEYFITCNEFSALRKAEFYYEMNKTATKYQIMLVGQGNNSVIDYSFLKVKLTSDAFWALTGSADNGDRVKIDFLNIRIYFKNIDISQYSANSLNITAKIPINSPIYVQYIQGLNASSNSPTEWDRFEVKNIPLSNFQDFCEIPFKTTENQATFQFFYEFLREKIRFTYDFFGIISQTSMILSPVEGLNIDWNLTKAFNVILQARQLTKFVFFIKVNKISVITNPNIFLMFLLSWEIFSNELNEIHCVFNTTNEIEITADYLIDHTNKQSALILNLSNIIDNMEDYLICDSFMTPTSRSFEGGYGYIINSEGIILSKKDMDPELFILDAGSLELKRLLVTPNNLNFPASHYAFYFTPQFKLQSFDYIGINLPSSFYPNVSNTSLICYISYLPSDYEIPESGSYFNFDEFEYEGIYERNIDFTNVIKLKSSDCIVKNRDNSRFAMYIAVQLDIDQDILEGSLLLFEVFGIPNPNSTKATIQIQVFRYSSGLIIEPLMESSSSYTHYFIDEPLNYINNINISMNCIMPYHINSLLHSPTIVKISLNELILPNFLISIIPSHNLIKANENNSNVRIFVDIYSNNIEISSLENLQFSSLEQDGIIGSETVVKEILNNSNNKAQSQNQFMIPIVKNFSKTAGITQLNIGRPSLSLRTLQLSFYEYLLPDDDDNICATVYIDVKESNLFNQTVCFKFLRADVGKVVLNLLRNDVFLETFKSNLSFELSTDFELNGYVNFLVIIFDEPITIPDEISIWMNNSLVYYTIYDKLVISYLPYIPKNTLFRVDITEYINPSSLINKTGVVNVGIIYENYSSIIAQKIFSIEKTQNLDDVTILIEIVDVNPTSFYTYESLDTLNISLMVYYYQPTYNDTIRVILPYDFPPNYFFKNQTVNCSVYINKTKISNAICDWKGRSIDIYLITTFQIYNSTLSIDIILNNIFSSVNYGNCGDLSVLIYSLIEGKNIVLGANYRIFDTYINPVMIQNLEQIVKANEYFDNQLNIDVNLIGLKRGSIKAIYLKPKDNKGFKNDMMLSFSLSGNSDIQLLNTSVQIKSGDFYSVFYIAASMNASEVLSFLQFEKKEYGIIDKYQQIYPLQIAIEIMKKIIILTPLTVSMYIGGKSYFIEISLSDIPNFEFNLTLIANNDNLITIIPSKTLKFSSNQMVNRFRISLSDKISPSSSSTDDNYILFMLSDNIPDNIIDFNYNAIFIKTFLKPSNLAKNLMNYTANLQIYSKTIDIQITNLNFPVFVYFQIFLNGTNELTNQEIVNIIDNEAKLLYFNETIGTLGIFQCNDTGKTFVERVEGLRVTLYNIKIFVVSSANIEADTIYRNSFEPYPIKPLVMSLGFNCQVQKTQYNDFLCAFVDFFSINSQNLFLENNETCNFSLYKTENLSIPNIFSSIYSHFSTLDQSLKYVQGISGTLSEMNLNLDKITNLNFPLLNNLVANIVNLENIITEKALSSINLYLYPPDSNPNFDLTMFSSMINDNAKISYFKAKYPFLSAQFYLKVSGIIAAEQDLQSIVPHFIGSPIVRTADGSVSLTFQLTSEGIVYGIIVKNSDLFKIPTAEEIAYGLYDKLFEKTELDSEGNFKSITLKYYNLENDVVYNIYYTVGLIVPKEPLIGKTVYSVRATPTDPQKITRKRRVLYADED